MKLATWAGVIAPRAGSVWERNGSRGSPAGPWHPRPTRRESVEGIDDRARRRVDGELLGGVRLSAGRYPPGRPARPSRPPRRPAPRAGPALPPHRGLSPAGHSPALTLSAHHPRSRASDRTMTQERKRLHGRATIRRADQEARRPHLPPGGRQGGDRHRGRGHVRPQQGQRGERPGRVLHLLYHQL